MYECKEDKQEIVQQPADLTTLSANLAMAAVSYIQKQAGEVELINSCVVACLSHMQCNVVEKY